MTAKLDYSATWNDTTLLLRSHCEGVVAIAGLFVFVPDLAARMFVGVPELAEGAGVGQMVQALQQHYVDHWSVLLVTTLISLFGAVAIYALLSRRELPKIGDALKLALPILPFYFVAQILVGIVTGIGLFALILPGLYLSARLSLTPVAQVSRFPMQPIRSMVESWNMTRGVGWAVFLLALIVTLVIMLAGLVAELLVGLPAKLIAGPEGIPLLQNGVSALGSSILSVVLAALCVAIYGRLSTIAGESIAQSEARE